MHEAAVGFQCPSCVAEGARTTRSGRTAYGGKRSANPSLTSLVLIGLNAAVFLVLLATGRTSSVLFDKLVLIPQGRCHPPGDPTMVYPDAGRQECLAAGADWVGGVASGAWWQPVTSAFTHVEIWHIGFNMLALWILGPQLEAVLGRARFLAVYAVSGLAGSAAVMWLSDPLSGTLGASGAVFGLMGALLVVAHKVGGNYQPILVWIGINVAITVVGSSFISWQGHFGGLVAGLASAAVVVHAPRQRRGAWQAGGLGALAVLVLLATVSRALLL